MWDIIKDKSKSWGMFLVLALVVIVIIYFAWQHLQNKETQLQKATVLNQQQVQAVAALQSELTISKQNAEMLANQVKAAIAGKSQPIVTFVQPAANVEQAAVNVQERINTGDATLPAAALAKTDRTVVTPQKVTQKDGTTSYQVGVYKTNLYRNWEVSAGYGRHGGDTYVPIEVQRNFDKVHSVSIEYHAFGENTGYEVKYTIRTDKLLVLF